MSKVQKLFNSPWGVAALSVVAVVTIYNKVIQPMLDDNDSASYAESGMDERSDVNDLITFDDDMSDDQASTKSRINNNTKKIDLAQLVWLKHPVRDPFKPVKKIKRNTQVQAPAPVLSAILAGGSVTLAVLNGEIVETGNRVGIYTVTKIAQQSVSLSGPHGQTLLTMNRSE